MFKVNDNYLKLPGSYLFSTIGKKVSAYSAAHPDKKIIRLGIGDVTQPLAPAIIDALHGAVDEMGKAETFHGYAPDLGYEFLRNAIAENDYKARGCDIAPDEIFVSDGAKCDCGNIQEIFSLDNKIAVCDPVYPVYVDSNVMAGRTGTYDPKSETWSDVIYMPCLAENGFAPELPKETPEQQVHKAAVLEKALDRACAVPLEVMTACGEGIALAAEYAEKGSVLARSDAGCAALFCKAAMQAAGLNVKVNTRLMADKARADALEARAEQLLAEFVPQADRVYQTVSNE